MNLLELFYDSVSKYPEKECLRYKKDNRYTSLTYREVWQTINEFAVGLKACGVKEGDKVGIMSANCPQWAISDFAIMLLGAVVVPIYPTLPASQVEYILHNGEVSWLLAENDLQLEKVKSIWPDHLTRVVKFFGNVSVYDGKELTFNDVCAIGVQQELTMGPLDRHAIPPDRLATIVHTSGTSGTPKGVMLSHRNIVSNIRASLSYLSVQPSDLALSYLPLSHIFERTVGQFAVLSSGAAIAYAENIEKIQQNLQEVRPTVLCTVPRLLEKVYAKINERIANLPRILHILRLVDPLVRKKLKAGFGGRIRFMVSGGAGLAAEIAEFFTAAKLPVYEGYGMTEAAPVICANPLGEARAGTVGLPIPGVAVKLGEDGELLAKGPNVMLGYYNNPEETAKTITEDGWLYTGDVAQIENGYVRIVDRKKNILVLATGKNVAPWPIENSISLSPHIAQAVLIGDKRTYVTCLLVPDFAALRPIALEQQLGEEQRVWVQHPDIRKLIRREVVEATESLADFEKPKRAILLEHDLTMEDGDLTPTLKVRSKIVLEKYGDRIEAMYAGTDYLPIAGDEPDRVAPAASEGVTGDRKPGDSKADSSKFPYWLYAATGIAAGILVRFWIRG
jgi:long-chain acyl-CoA synthetase